MERIENIHNVIEVATSNDSSKEKRYAVRIRLSNGIVLILDDKNYDNLVERAYKITNQILLIDFYS